MELYKLQSNLTWVSRLFVLLSLSLSASLLSLSLSLTISPYYPSLLEGIWDSTQCSYRADVYISLLVGQPWHVDEKEFIRERHLWVLPNFPIALIMSWMVCGMGGMWLYSSSFMGRCFQDFFSKEHVAFLWGLIEHFLHVFRWRPGGASIEYYRHGYRLEEILLYSINEIRFPYDR